MAIDTASKRFGILDFDLPIAPGMMPPDSAIGQGDRQALLWLYPGILAGSVNDVNAYSYTVPARDGFTVAAREGFTVTLP